jgi:two-component system copper resistance phosphate regulon response regulator CusR
MEGFVMTTTTDKTRVLLFEDDGKSTRLIERTLSKCGYQVDVAPKTNGNSANGRGYDYNLMVVEGTMTGVEGNAVLKSLRSRPKGVPLLFISEVDQSTDITKILEEGVDDFLAKPIEEGELCARVKAALWRNGASIPAVLQAQDLTMDVAKRVVRRAGKTINLTRTEFSLLELLLRNKNSVLTRTYIREQVWGSKFEDGTNIVDVYINYLRSSVDREYTPKLIQTVRGKGFILRQG